MKDEEVYLKYRQDPLFFIEDMWNLKPQPLKEEHPEADLEDYKAEWFGEFERGEHITWQEWIIVRAVKQAMSEEDRKRISIASGHGIGKDATLSWLILWYLFVHRDAQVPCTAPTGEQMYDILWKELSKWLKRMPEQIQAQYEWQSNYLRIKESPETWFARAKTARKEKPEALAGVHGENVFLVADEASGVEDVIYKTAEGALTGEDVLFVMIGNMLRRDGFFYEAHYKDEDWRSFNFNSEDSPIVDEDFIERIKSKYGEDSDEYRIRVLGQAPSEEARDEKGYVRLLTETEVEQAMSEGQHFGEEKLGVDVGDTGSDESVGVKRSNGYAEVCFADANLDPTDAAGEAVHVLEDIDSNKVFVDRTGVGGDTHRRLQEVNAKRNNPDRINIYPVNFGESATDKDKFLNKRAEIFWRLRSWIKQGGKLSKNDSWMQLLDVKWKRNARGKLKIMPKDVMRREGIPSPDKADALALTFYEPDTTKVATKEDKRFYKRMRQKKKSKGETYNRKQTSY